MIFKIKSFLIDKIAGIRGYNLCKIHMKEFIDKTAGSWKNKGP